MMITVDFKIENGLRIGFDFGDATKTGTLKITGINIAGFLPFEFITDDQKIKIDAHDGTTKIGNQTIILTEDEEDGQAHLAIMID